MVAGAVDGLGQRMKMKITLGLRVGGELRRLIVSAYLVCMIYEGDAAMLVSIRNTYLFRHLTKDSW